MATQDKAVEDQKQFADSFNEEPAAPQEQSEDAAFGISPSDDDSAGNPPAQVMDGDAGKVDESSGTQVPNDSPAEPANAQVEGSPEEEAHETPAEEAAESEAGNGQMTEQQLRSWEGRLKKQQADLDAKAQSGGGDDSAEKIEEIAADVKSGDISAEEAIQKLSEDFGPEFVGMIQSIAKSVASETASSAIGETNQNVESIINHIADANKKAHFKAISSAHPDFMEVHASPEFVAWLGTRGPDEAEDKRKLDSGTADEVNSVLDAFKKSQEQTDKKVSDHGDINGSEADAAEGVRSGGIQLPVEPDAQGGSYEEAWNKA